MTAYNPVQDGFFHPTTSPWNGDGLWHEDDTVFFALGTTGPSGLIFDVSTAYDYTAMSLTLEKVFPSVSTYGALELYLVNAAAPGLWSTGNPPVIAGATLVASISPEEYTLGPRTWTLDMAVVDAVTVLPGWAGRLALVLRYYWEGSEGVSRTFASMENADPAAWPVLTTVGTPIVPPTTGKRMVMPHWPLPPDESIGG